MIEDAVERGPAQRWQLDKSVPLALIMAFICQTLAGTWWLSTFSERTTTKIESLEKRQEVLDKLPERLAKQEAQLGALVDGMKGLRDDVRDLAGRRTK